LSDVKEIGFHTATATGVDQVADIGVSSSDNAIERSVDLLERLQCLELLDVCLIGFDDGLVGVVVPTALSASCCATALDFSNP